MRFAVVYYVFSEKPSDEIRCRNGWTAFINAVRAERSDIRKQKCDFQKTDDCLNTAVDATDYFVSGYTNSMLLREDIQREGELYIKEFCFAETNAGKAAYGSNLFQKYSFIFDDYDLICTVDHDMIHLNPAPSQAPIEDVNNKSEKKYGDDIDGNAMHPLNQDWASDFTRLCRALMRHHRTEKLGLLAVNQLQDCRHHPDVLHGIAPESNTTTVVDQLLGFIVCTNLFHQRIACGCVAMLPIIYKEFCRRGMKVPYWCDEEMLAQILEGLSLKGGISMSIKMIHPYPS